MQTKLVCLGLWLTCIGAEAAIPRYNPLPLRNPYPSLGFVEREGYSIEFKVGPQGTLLSIATKAGVPVAQDVSVEQLGRKSTHLYRIVQRAIMFNPPQTLRRGIRPRPPIAWNAKRKAPR